MFLDIFILFILAVSTMLAFMRGFIREALTLVTITVALAATYYGGPLLSPLMDSWLGVVHGETQKVLGILPLAYASLGLAYGLIFITLLIVFSISSNALAEFVKSIGLGAIDRSLGALFGLIRGILLLAVLYLPLHFILDNQTKQEWFGNSRGHVYLEKSSLALAKLLPTGLISTDNDNSDKAAPTSPTTDEPSSARTKLKAMDLLKKNLDEADRKKLVHETIPPAPEKEDKTGGYDNDFREELDNLFEKNIKQPEFNE